MREVIEEGEDDAEGLLHAQEAVEWPLAMKLVYGLHVGRVARESLVRNDMLAGVIALSGTIPEQDAAVEGWQTMSKL